MTTIPDTLWVALDVACGTPQFDRLREKGVSPAYLVDVIVAAVPDDDTARETCAAIVEHRAEVERYLAGRLGYA